MQNSEPRSVVLLLLNKIEESSRCSKFAINAIHVG